MHLLITTWPYALGYWVVFLWVFVPEFGIVARANEPSSTPQDANSKRLIMLSGWVSICLAFLFAFNFPIAALPQPAAWYGAGLALMVAGGLLRRHCWRMLGTNFTGAVIVKADQAVVDRGAYRYVRHPSYTAGALVFIGIGCVLANWASLAVIVICLVAAYGYRVHVEERALVTTIGRPYVEYMQRTKRFIPFVM